MNFFCSVIYCKNSRAIDENCINSQSFELAHGFSEKEWGTLQGQYRVFSPTSRIVSGPINKQFSYCILIKLYVRNGATFFPAAQEERTVNMLCTKYKISRFLMLIFGVKFHIWERFAKLTKLCLIPIGEITPEENGTQKTPHLYCLLQEVPGQLCLP